MRCRVGDMRHKEVINMKDGSRLGTVCDAEIDTNTASLTAIIIYGRLKFLGIMGREDDIVIGWKDIEVIGEDTILVNYQECYKPRRKKGFFSSIFSGD